MLRNIFPCAGHPVAGDCVAPVLAVSGQRPLRFASDIPAFLIFSIKAGCSYMQPTSLSSGPRSGSHALSSRCPSSGHKRYWSDYQPEQGSL